MINILSDLLGSFFNQFFEILSIQIRENTHFDSNNWFQWNWTLNLKKTLLRPLSSLSFYLYYWTCKLLYIHLYWINLCIILVCRNVKSELHQRHGSIIILVKLQSDLILSCCWLRDIVQWNLKGQVVVNDEVKTITWNK